MEQPDSVKNEQRQSSKEPKQIKVQDSGIGCLLFLIFIALFWCAMSIGDISHSIDRLTEAIQAMPK